MNIVIALSTFIGAYLLVMGLRVMLLRNALKNLKEEGGILWKLYGNWGATAINPMTVRWIFMPAWVIGGAFLFLNGLCYFFPGMNYCSITFFQVTAW